MPLVKVMTPAPLLIFSAMTTPLRMTYYTWTVRGAQIGLVNIVRDNPTPLRVRPVFNTSL